MHVGKAEINMKNQSDKQKKNMIRILSGQQGSSIILFALSLMVIAGCAALVTDIGMLAIEKAKLANAVDSATLAASRAYLEHPGTERAVAASYLEKNGYPGIQFVLNLNSTNKTVEIIASQDVPYGFGKILGIDKATVQSRAVAQVLPVLSVSHGIRPFALSDMTLYYGDSYTLKEGDGSTGNFGVITLGRNGASTYLDNIIEGYDGRLMVGDKIVTETGNISGSTYTGVTSLLADCTHNPICTATDFQPDCPRLITIVIVDSMAVNGNETVTIKGFASFFLTGVDGQGKDSVVHGTFVRSLTAGETGVGQSDYGLYGVKLIQ